MIGKLKGLVDGFGDDYVHLDVGGVVYEAFCSTKTLQALPQVGHATVVHVEMIVREDMIKLYGFATEAEKLSTSHWPERSKKTRLRPNGRMNSRPPRSDFQRGKTRCRGGLASSCVSPGTGATGPGCWARAGCTPPAQRRTKRINVRKRDLPWGRAVEGKPGPARRARSMGPWSHGVAGAPGLRSCACQPP